jgi:aspartyl aminopeptidase
MYGVSMTIFKGVSVAASDVTNTVHRRLTRSKQSPEQILNRTTHTGSLSSADHIHLIQPQFQEKPVQTPVLVVFLQIGEGVGWVVLGN